MRLFRREWRQQILVLSLLTFSVAAATLARPRRTTWRRRAMPSSAPPTTASGCSRAPPQQIQARVDAIRAIVGTVDVIAGEFEAVPGSVEDVEFRAQDPRGPYGGPLLALRAGRYPEAADEVAVTDKAATLLGTRLERP